MRSRIPTLLCLLVLLLGPIAAAVPGGDGAFQHPPSAEASGPEGVLLHLRAGTFDPVNDPAPGPAWLTAGGTHPFYVVQFDGPIQKAWRESAAEAGAELLDYLPDFAYFARIGRGDLDQVRALDHVRYVGPAHLCYRIDPALWYPTLSPMELEVLTWGERAAASTAERVVREGGRVVYLGYDSLTVELPPLTAMVMAADPDLAVSWVEPKYWPHMLLDNDARSARARQSIDGPYLSNDKAAWSYNSANDAFEGWTGENVTVSVCDSGLDDSHPAFSGRIEHYYDYGNDGQADYSGHGTHCAGIVLGDGSWRSGSTGTDGKYSGLAPEAGLVVQEIFNNYYGIATYNRDATRSGATISSNSWGYGEFGAYYTVCHTYDDHTRDGDAWRAGDQPLLFSFSAGNDGRYGSNSITPPATAKNVITVGATGNDKYGVSHNTVAGFSSRGPTDDGRLKPDVVIPGHMVVAARSTDPYACRGWARPADGQTSYVYASGTSMAAPGVAGAAAVLTQYLEEEEGMDDPSPALLKACLINGARPLEGYDYPGNVQGWGSVNMARTLFETDSYHIIRFGQETELDTEEGSDEYTQWFMVQDDEPLKVTLVWTDPGGTTSASKHLVNDLDLELVSPSGRRYAGNNFVNDQSVNDSVGYQDRRNNVEGFLLDSPEEGIWTINVKAYNVPSGPQDFALVVSGNAEKGYIDLSPVALKATPQGLEEYHAATLVGTLKNLGNRLVDVFDYKVEQVGPGGTVTLLKAANHTDLGGGLQKKLSWHFTGERGTHRMRLTLDPADLVTESNESNNVIEVEYFFRGYGVRIFHDATEVSADPGELVEFNLTVRNRGNVPDELRVSITAAPPGWTAHLVADTFDLDPNGRTPVLVSVIPPEEALAGDSAEITFTVTSQGNTSKTRSVVLRVEVNQVFGLELTAPVSHLKLLPGEEGDYSLLVKNPGNGVDVYELIPPPDLDPGWFPAIPEGFLTIGHRDLTYAVVRLGAPNPSPAGTSIAFELLVRSTKSEMEATVRLTAEVLQFHENAYEMEPRVLEAEVGTTIDVPLTVENLGNGPVEYSLGVLAPTSMWEAGFDVPSLKVDGYAVGEAALSLTVPDDAINGSYDFSVSAVPTGGRSFAFNFSFTVLQYHDLDMQVLNQPGPVTQGMPVEVLLHIDNLGNGVETARVLVPALPPLWSYDLESDTLQVDPFDSLEISVAVQTSKETPGGTYTVEFLTRYGAASQATSADSVEVTVLTRPDLQVAGGHINISDPEPLVGSMVQLSVRVANTGETPAIDVYVQFYVDSVPLGQPLFVTSIEPGEVVILSTSWNCNTTGYHQISVELDSTGDVDETQEGNNGAFAQLRVKKLNMKTSPGFGALAIVGALLVVVAALGSRRGRRR